MDTERIERIVEIIDDYGDGDEVFKKKFTHECLLAYKNFHLKFNGSIESEDFELFCSIRHKLTAVNSMFEFELLDQYLTAMRNSDSPFTENRLIENINQEVNYIIDNFNNLYTKL